MRTSSPRLVRALPAALFALSFAPSAAAVESTSEESDTGFPWVVHVQGVESCHGTLVHPRWVLTAAHCFAETVGEVVVSYSRTDPKTGSVSGGTQSIPLDSLFAHPGYPAAVGHDIALVRLPALFEPDPFLVPVELPRRRPVVGSEATIAGNGASTPDKVAVLRGSVGVGLCEHDANEFCVQAPDAGLCKGDSGSGVIGPSDGVDVVVGVVASVIIASGCTPGGPSTATDVVPFLDWITATMGASTLFTAGFHPSTQLYASDLDFGLPSSWDTVVGDFDGDANDDYARLGSTGAFLFFGGTDGAFTSGLQDYAADGYWFDNPSSWTTIHGDFDGDGREDYARIGDTGAWVFFGEGDRSFTPSFQDYEGLDFGLPSPGR